MERNGKDRVTGKRDRQRLSQGECKKERDREKESVETEKWRDR